MKNFNTVSAIGKQCLPDKRVRNWGQIRAQDSRKRYIGLPVSRSKRWKWLQQREEELQPVKERFLQILETNGGNTRYTLRQTGISRTQYYRWMHTDEWFREEVELTQYLCRELAMMKLFELVEQGNSSAIIFFLKNFGQRRGYGK